MDFTKQNASILRDEIVEALKIVGAKHDVAFSLGTIRGSASSIRVTLECASTNGVQDGEDPVMKNAFMKNCFMFNLNKEDFGKEFVMEGKKCKIVGLKPKSRKYPVIVKCSDGKMYKFSAQDVKYKISK